MYRLSKRFLAHIAKYTNNHTHLTGAKPEKLLDFYTRVMGGKVDPEFLLGDSPKAWDVKLGGLLIRISEMPYFERLVW